MKKSLSRPIAGIFLTVLIISFVSCASTPKSGQSTNVVQANAQTFPSARQDTAAVPAEETDSSVKKPSDAAKTILPERETETGGTENRTEITEAQETLSPSAPEASSVAQSEEPPVPADVAFVRELQALLSVKDTEGALKAFENLPQSLNL